MPSKYVLNKQMNVASSSGGIRLPGGDFKTVCCMYVCIYMCVCVCVYESFIET